jgi:hypothetical protein
MANKWLKQLKAYDDAVDYEYDSFAYENCRFTPSPYFNWIYANKSHGCPKNASILYFSEPKAGKSLSIYAQVLDMQRREKHLPPDERNFAIIFNTELRGQLQHDVFPEIDKDYMIIYDTNDPVEIFDRVDKDIKPMVQDGMKIGILAIDSLTGILGVKRNNADSVADHLVGDHALTVSIGLAKLVPFCKRNKILLIATSQMRGNVDAANKYAPKEKMAESWAAKHGFEYFISLKKAGAAEDKQDIEGKTFSDEDQIDARGNNLVTGHKIYVKMELSSIGQSGRSGVFFMDYKKGIINQHEEIFFLAKNTGVIKLEGRTYTFQDQKWIGKKECALAIRDNPELAAKILEEIRKLDQ